MSCALVLAVLLLVPGSDSVEAVRFAGNRSFSGRVLSGVVTVRARQPLDERRLDLDMRQLEAFYRENGFDRVQVGRRVNRGRRQFVVVFNVIEGPRTRVAVVAFSGNAVFRAGELERVVTARPGRFVAQGMLAASEDAVRTRYSDAGYPFVKVSGSWERRDSTAILLLEIVEGPRCVIGAVRVRGNRTVRTATVLRATELRAGRLVNVSELQAAQRRLYATRLFQRVAFTVVRGDSTRKQGSDTVEVRFDVAEQAYRTLSFGGGFEAPPFRLLTSVGWAHDNLFNQGQQLALDLEFSPGFRGEYRTSAEANWRVPYLILTRHDLVVRPFASLEKLDSVPQKEIGLETGVSRNLASYLSVGLLNRVRLVSDTAGSITNLLGLNAQLDNRDNVFDTRSGGYFRPMVEAAGGWLGGDNDFYRVSAELRGFVTPGAGVVLAGRAMAGRVFTFGRTVQAPFFESFTLGGRNSLRGYDDASLGPDSTGPRTAGGRRFGPQVLNGNFEVRSPYAWGWVGLVGFMDAGEVTSAERGFLLDELAYSAGLGIRVATPIGPVRVDWGKRLHDPEPGDKGRFYVGLLHAF